MPAAPEQPAVEGVRDEGVRRLARDGNQYVLADSDRPPRFRRRVLCAARASIPTRQRYAPRRSSRRGGGRGRKGFTLIEGTATWAEPAGFVGRATYEGLRDEILDQLRAALPGRHRAVRPSRRDGGGWLRRLRGRSARPRARDRRVRDAVIGVELDPHCHLSDLMVDSSERDRHLQGGPAHGFSRARGGAGRSLPARRRAARSSL